MRLNFSFIEESKMEPGIRILAALLEDKCLTSYTPVPYLFTGAGNNFVVLDGRAGGMDPYRDPARIGALCRAHHTDGLMILTVPVMSGLVMTGSDRSSSPDFAMEFYNPDGSGGMMCGNGGRCIVAFADYLGLKPASPDGTWRFLAPDGLHTAEILRRETSGPGPAPRPIWTVRLKMIDVEGVTPIKGGYFLNTGTRHFVQFRSGIDSLDMEREAKPLRWDPAFQPEGTNVNFVEVRADGLHVRTFEKGVEGETLACGTGITASAIAAYEAGIPGQAGNDRHARPRPGISYRLQCRRGDWLSVEFTPDGAGFKDVYLTGPAELISLE